MHTKVREMSHQQPGPNPPEGYHPPQAGPPPFIPAQHGTPPAGAAQFGAPTGPMGPSPRPPRKWYQKKRIVIPAAIVAVLVLVPLMGQGGKNADTTPAVAASSAPVKTPDSKPVTETTPTTSAPATSAPATNAPAPATSQEPPEPSAPQISVSQEQAVRTAENYLSFTAFSRKGLIKQLEYEKFSKEDASYAVDHIQVDWNEQAAKHAKQYLDLSSFSRSGLIKQLKFEGYTDEQAKHGAAAVGLK